MQTRHRELFSTVRTEGALLPPDLLQRVADGDRELEGLTPEAYHLAANERLGEAITRSWNRLVGTWAGFRDSLDRVPTRDPATSVTRERWLLILFEELGYGRLPTARAVELDAKSYAVSHAWETVPIHLIGARIPLDRRTPGVAGAAGQSPHGLLQELLNRSDERLWGFVSNGLLLRVLRDNSSLTRQAFVEFDLEAMMDGEVYSDFVVLWLLCHESRVAGKPLEQCWLERWVQLAVDRGTRALESLRAGVEEAIVALGCGFLAHPANRSLRDVLRSGELSKEDYYRQLLRLVYRLLFLFVAEDRELLLAPDASQELRDRYARFFSTQRLRRLAERRRGGKHSDLYDGLRFVMRKLGEDEGCSELGLPPLGSFLWSAKAAPDLVGAQLANLNVLEAVRALAFIEEGGTRRAVDYKNLGSEELGSVYESLLELHPVLNVDAGAFDLDVGIGHERKTTGSYYTPTSLINLLVGSTLDPVLEEAGRTDDPERAILALAVCDPACGSGHFLVAAAHRIAKRLASVRTGDEEPSPEATRHALRDVVGRCLYGVDVNPMAIELCKVALWMEALDPGRPLSFLESHIKCGNSLLGATPELIAAGIPDDAFKPVEGDDREIATALRARNRRERSGQLALEDEVAKLGGRIQTSATALEQVSDDSIANVHEKEEAFSRLASSTEYARARSVADAWSAAFVVPKKESSPQITHATLERLARGEPVDADVITAVADARIRHEFIHWHLEYPTVFRATGASGFDCVIGNPPWDRIQLEEKQFFASLDPEIATASARRRKQLIESLGDRDAGLLALYTAKRREIVEQSQLIRMSGLYPLSGQGNLASNSLFIELTASLLDGRGLAGLIVPSGIATQDNQKALFASLVRACRIVSLYDFENRQRLFADVDSRIRFCLLTIAGAGRSVDQGEYAFALQASSELSDDERLFSMGVHDLERFSPNTLSCPAFHGKRDARIADLIYEAGQILLRENPKCSPWGWQSWQMLNETHEANELRDWDSDWEPHGLLRIYEAKLIHQFEHRFATYVHRDGGWATESVSVERKLDPAYEVTTRYCARASLWPERVEARTGRTQRWTIAYRLTARSTDERTAIFCVLPVAVATVGLPLAVTDCDASSTLLLLANLNSLVFDFVTRLRVTGVNLNHFIVHQLPVLTPASYEGGLGKDMKELIRSRALELTFTSYELEDFARECGYEGPPFAARDDRRSFLRAEIDAMFLHLYGIDRADAAYILDTFPIIRRHDERLYGNYRTRNLVLDRYDSLSEKIAAGQPYESPLDPPAANPRDAHPPNEEHRREAIVLQFPFPRVEGPLPSAIDPSLVPIYTLRAAADALGGGEAVEPDGWAELNGQRRTRPGMFVAQVRGRSMEPRIPDGSWCLFSSPVEGSLDGRILLVEHRAIDDPDNGGSHTVKRYCSRRRALEGGLWEHEEIVLEPLNPEYEPVVLPDVGDGECRVIAELVEVLG